MSYGGGYGGGGYSSGAGSPGRPRQVGAFAPQEFTRQDRNPSLSRGIFGGGDCRNAGPGPARGPPGAGAFSVQDASRPVYGYQPPGGGGVSPAQRRFGDGGPGGYGAGAPQTGRGGDGGYGGTAIRRRRARRQRVRRV